MSDTVIKVENLSKQYRIGGHEGYKTFRETLVEAAKAPFVRLSGAMRGAQSAKRSKPNSMRHAPSSMLSSSSDDTIWALKDVSFEVKQGEVVGIIGRNGAGKSTLLKILSQITEPTKGRVELKGRIGSLLEVGTGFHPELSGHENIYLYGAILGMDRWEVTRKFDEIVAFAEIEQFIDTPVKRYSSGMYMRLAFAVAAHLEPEILLVDEVLAVGDAAFQKKCLGKMGDVSKEGRTVLFVSHNMKAVSSLCQECILLSNGELAKIGLVDEVVNKYLISTSHLAPRGQTLFKSPSSLPFCVSSICTCNKKGMVVPVFPRSGPIEIRMEGDIRIPSPHYLIALDVRAVDDTLLFRTHSFEQPESFNILSGQGPFELECIFPPFLFPATTYRLGIVTAIAGKRELQSEYPALEFDIVQDHLLGNLFIETKGLLTPVCEWKRG